MFHRCRAKDNICCRVYSDELHLQGNFFWQQVVTRIEVLQPLAARKLKQPVPSHIAAAIRAGFPTNSIAKTFDDFKTCVSRAVINDDHLFLRPRLPERALDRLPDPAL